MAGGIDWFRWHHGSVSDQKWPLVARRSGSSVAEVIAVWACLLEFASMATDRGNPGVPDFEAMDCALGMDDGKAQAIYTAMLSRSLIDPESSRIAAWDKRQPKREREDDSSTVRVRAFRERQRNETPCNGAEHAETPREEKSREEKIKEESKTKAEPRKRDPIPDKPDGVTDQTWADWLALRKAKRAVVSPTVIKGAEVEAAKAGLSLEEFLQIWCRRGSQGLEAQWLLNGTAQPRASPGYPQSKQAALEARNAEAGRIAKQLIFGEAHDA